MKSSGQCPTNIRFDLGRAINMMSVIRGMPWYPEAAKSQMQANNYIFNEQMELVRRLAVITLNLDKWK
jgi:hypothetical protein